MREIVLDTETTGLDPAVGHRLVEVACVELANRLPTGRTFQSYFNPDRDIPEEAFRVHGLSREFLSAHPRFADKVDDFLEFVGDSPLVIHNAEFDLKFLRAEIKLCNRDGLRANEVVDTVDMARKKFPGSPASLDALCRRFSVDLSQRSLHGALLDCELLAQVYVELTGGRQRGLGLETAATGLPIGPAVAAVRGPVRPPRPFAPTPEEAAAFEAFVAGLKAPIWKN
ncbi:MAG TPA: DNA polymerase III subunit epsilon [Alphaproteobacteria bacterium]|nr:DNA polymerase III subunit epsilon [Alphaproteobacteria bacterium]